MIDVKRKVIASESVAISLKGLLGGFASRNDVFIMPFILGDIGISSKLECNGDIHPNGHRGFTLFGRDKFPLFYGFDGRTVQNLMS